MQNPFLLCQGILRQVAGQIWPSGCGIPLTKVQEQSKLIYGVWSQFHGDPWLASVTRRKQGGIWGIGTVSVSWSWVLVTGVCSLWEFIECLLFCVCICLLYKTFKKKKNELSGWLLTSGVSTSLGSAHRSFHSFYSHWLLFLNKSLWRKVLIGLSNFPTLTPFYIQGDV